MSRNAFGIAVVVATLALVACGTQPVHNVTAAPVVSSKADPSLDDVTKAIVRAGSALGWQMAPTQPGHITGTLYLRTHVAIVDVNYDQKNYSIKYRDSKNLDYDGTNIHKNYNGWIQNLDKGIRTQLSNL